MARREVPKVTAAGRRRVLAALERHGLLLVQGQAEAPSVADLHAGAPVTVRGYAYDYVPAWLLREELAARDDVALVKLVRGRSTLVHARHWPALEALARAARVAVLGGRARTGRRELLAAIEAHPGASGEALKAALDLPAAEFQRRKNDLASWLCVDGRDQEEDAEHHTHDQAWYPWAEGKVGRALRGAPLPTPDEAAAALLAALRPAAGARPPRAATLLPALGVCAAG
ncbi:MAG: hypothetical protein M9894_02095 [Planctomycetes bacterium]|nr:hypothetical protein [Planctomycetota bacterium]